ncbi:MAG: saccharopine dehydrogenase NADP-binding domain-containing protein [Gammaproteobacteria bacterium]|nr:saccharopine dehydrogenase NADP-binding domain-containing protein [Gammaproteobacteria bacterium]MDE2345190.1 saccharopine dehydrogenase NADP-binding domain-containing protein [Gammaproteobacteria bacterium]
MHICVLGAGMVGGVIAQDLAQQHDVTSVDVNDAALSRLAGRGIKTLRLDISDARALAHCVQPFALVVSAVPGFMGFETLKTLLQAGKPVADISFFPEDALALDTLARDKGVTALVDMGVAPGMDNLIFGHHDAHMRVTRFECLVGGLPQHPKPPFFYKAPFSPIDVIEEYTRPARLQRGGRVVTLPALSECELREFEGVGRLEAFNTDGLRTLLRSMAHVPEMAEKTLRYPGHVALIQALKDAGFFADAPLEIGAARVRPLDVSAQLLLKQWRLEPGEPELTVMRVTVAGEERGRQVRHVWDLLDRYDPATGYSSMARTTGFTCAAAANLLLEGGFKQPGVHPPELVGRHDGCFDFVCTYLQARHVEYRHRCEAG